MFDSASCAPPYSVVNVRWSKNRIDSPPFIQTIFIYNKYCLSQHHNIGMDAPSIY
ncbi:hypothetical protein HMPREF3293_01645 [Christensenella minuta]|uniref:Uncharacterized protein n=1 Tax=Christensenella minuta TaxID=626937 RepID=A0A136Q414_9FIRM|nr:hypothetical protein HMPREF3293_01645 [Christensenella minuta]